MAPAALGWGMLVDEAASTKVPSDLAGYQFLTYSPGNLSPLMARLEKTIGLIVQRQETR